MHGLCPSNWRYQGDPAIPGNMRSASCNDCTLAVTSPQALAEIDPEAFAAAVDPDGVQRPPHP